MHANGHTQFDKDHDQQLVFDEFCQLMKSAILADEVRLKVRKGGSRHHVLTTGETLNVRDVHTDPRISDESRRRYALRGYDVRSLLLAPIMNEDGKVVGLIELVNREIDAPLESNPDGSSSSSRLQRRNSAYGFSQDEERLLKMLCAHCSIFLKHLEMDD